MFNSGLDRGEWWDRINIINTTVSYNRYGVRHYWDSYCYGAESWITIKGSTINNNEYYAFYTSSYGGSLARSYFKTAEWDVSESLIDGDVYINLAGAFSYQGYWQAKTKVSFVNNTYAHDRPIVIKSDAYYNDYYKALDATVIYKGNVHTSSSLTDGLQISLLGGSMLSAKVYIEDVNIYSPLGDGIRITLGTTYRYTQYQRQVSGLIDIRDVTIDGAIGNGISFRSQHYLDSGVFYNNFLSMENVVISNCDSALSTENMNGEVRNCKFINPRQFAIYVRGGVIDVFASIVGPIKTNNLYVDQMGAIRLWFHLTVHVVWEETGLPVVGAQVDIMDNSWKIIGVSSIEGPEGILFSNLNTHTVLSDGVFTRNPYLLNVDYLGILKETRAEVSSTSEITITLRDNINPRLFIESPEDSQMQSETTIEVRGNAYDLHTGIDRVEVSLNGGYWHRAEGTETYTFTIDDLPEGISVIGVRTYDNSKNMKEMVVTIYVDTTPPSLSVIAPLDGFMTSNRNLDVIGTSDVGATVLINNQHVTMDYTLISHRIVLVEGINEIRVTALDMLGNVNLITRSVTLDTHMPYISMLTDDMTVNTPRTTLVGLTEESGVVITVDGNEAPIDLEGRFEAEVSLGEGLNLIEVHGVDIVGNERTMVVKVFLDLTSPWFDVELPVDGSTVNDRIVLVKGFIEEGAKLFVNDKVVTVAFGQFETFINAPEGPSDLVFVAIDEAGNLAETKVSIEVDSISPTLTVQYPPDDLVTNKDEIRLEGYINPANEDLSKAQLYVNGVPWSLDKELGTFRGAIALAEGINRITVRAVDIAGNVDEVECRVMHDSEAPFLDVKLQGVRMDPQWNQPVAIHEYVYVTGFTEIGTTPTVNDVFVEVDPETGYFNYTLELPAPTGGAKISTVPIVVMSSDDAGNVAMETLEVNRLKTVKEDEGVATGAEWLVLLLALIIFGMAFIGALAYQRFQTQEEVIVSLEGQQAEVPSDGTGKPSPRAPPQGRRGSEPSGDQGGLGGGGRGRPRDR
jgi:hypothetical protein